MALAPSVHIDVTWDIVRLISKKLKLERKLERPSPLPPGGRIQAHKYVFLPGGRLEGGKRVAWHFDLYFSCPTPPTEHTFALENMALAPSVHIDVKRDIVCVLIEQYTSVLLARPKVKSAPLDLSGTQALPIE